MDNPDPSIAFFPEHCLLPKSGNKTRDGHFAFVFEAASGQMGMLHRLSYQMFIGVIPKGMLVMLTCGNNSCINPRHLILGTRTSMGKKTAENHCGEKIYSAKLTDDIVRSIRASDMTDTALAALYGVRRECISKVRNGKRWKHVKAKPD